MLDQYSIGVSYETAAPESAEYGDAAERGWIMEPESVTPESIEAFLEDGAYGFLADLLPFGTLYKGGYEAGNDRDFYALDVAVDLRTGESTRQTIHLSGDWPEHLYNEVRNFLTGK